MTDTALSQDAVAALVEAAQRGNLPAASGASTRRARVRRVDFTRPAKFTSDQERRLGRMVETFCRTASSRLSAELRMPVELELIGTGQLTWENAHAQLPEGAICGTLRVLPAGTRMLMGVERQLVLAAIERLLGGSGAPAVERRMTDIDWVVARLFFNRLLTQLSAIFADSTAVDLELEAVEGRLDSEQLAGVSQPTVTATIEVRHDKASSTITLLLPDTAFSPIVDAFGRTAADSQHDGADPEAVEAAVADVDVTVHAEVAALELPIESILAIRPGDVIGFDQPASTGVALKVGGVAVCRGTPGRIGPRRAVQVMP